MMPEQRKAGTEAGSRLSLLLHAPRTGTKAWHWRFFLFGTIFLSAAILAFDAVFGPPVEPELAVRGADISFTLQEEAIGQLVSDGGRTAPIEQILADRGANYARLRVWVNPEAGTSDLQSALTLARRAESVGMKLLLNLHYSDTWADRRSQTTPGLWADQDEVTLRQTVRTYTHDVVSAFEDQGTPVHMVQIGNEVTCGMLWPTGALCGPDSPKWESFMNLIKAGVEGAREAGRPNAPHIMIHIDTGGDFEGSAHFFDHLVAENIDFDMIGLSYYPFWHGPLTSLEHNLAALVHRYDKDIVLAETAYPWTLYNPSPSVVEVADALPQTAQYPPTPEGQAAYYEALKQTLRRVPGERVQGYFVWEPGWMPGVEAVPGVGTLHGNLTLFDSNGRGLPALEAFRPDGGASEE